MPQFWCEICFSHFSCVNKYARGKSDNGQIQFFSRSFLHYSTITRWAYLNVELSKKLRLTTASFIPDFFNKISTHVRPLFLFWILIGQYIMVFHGILGQTMRNPFLSPDIHFASQIIILHHGNTQDSATRGRFMPPMQFYRSSTASERFGLGLVSQYLA